MAGVKGKSGGYRPGAGRKPAEPVKLALAVPVVEDLAHKDPMVFLMALMNDLGADIKLRADAAKTLMMYTHAKKADQGAKAEKAEKAKKAATGKFAAAATPLRMVK